MLTSIRRHLSMIKPTKMLVNVCHCFFARYTIKISPICSLLQDSFCVAEDESEPDDTYVPSFLTQLEERLDEHKGGKMLPKAKQFKRIRIIEDSSPDSPAGLQNQRKRIKRFSSDSED